MGAAPDLGAVETETGLTCAPAFRDDDPDDLLLWYEMLYGLDDWDSLDPGAWDPRTTVTATGLVHSVSLRYPAATAAVRITRP